MTLSILIVEDDAKIAELIEMSLRKMDVMINYRNNGQDALSFLDQFTPDLILLDISMPVMNGWQFLELMQENPEKRDIPVIILTAHTDSTNRMIGQMEGVKAYLNKPVLPQVLRDTINQVLEQ
jgi:CheY-like chemotaxis protein